MAFDRDGVVRVTGKPLCLALQGLLGVGADRGGVRVEEDAVADIDREVLLAMTAGLRASFCIGLSAEICVRLIAGLSLGFQ